jgi:signal transduction histidine kinase
VYENLKKVDEARTWFLAKAAHDLKSPLAAIQSICQTLLEGYRGPLAQAQADMIERVRVRSAALQDTTNDLLLLARARSHAPRSGAETVELCEVLDETLRFFASAAEEAGVKLEISRPCEACRVTASRDGVHSVMTNLVSNAIKYSSAGSTVTVSLERSEAGARFTVTDHGIGIPAADRERLFREFFRASNARSHTSSGTGLGLAIVKSALDQMGGSIEVQSEEGKGTSVRVLFGGGC